MKEGKTPNMRKRVYEAMKSETPELEIWDLISEAYNDGAEKDTATIAGFAIFAFAIGIFIGHFLP